MILVLILAIGIQCVDAQIKINLKKKIEREANKRANQKTDKAVKKTFDSAEEGVSSAVTSDKKENKTTAEKPTTTDQPVSNDNHPEAGQENSSQNGTPNTGEQQQPQPVLNWAKYDFVPGTGIIFEDNQEGEQNGEFPSKWDLAGGTIENAEFDGSNAIYFRVIGNIGGITPMIKDGGPDYLPDEFTIEFDCFFEKDVYNQRYYVSFYEFKKHKKALDRLTIYINEAEYGTADIKGTYPGAERTNFDKDQSHWRHIAISFNKRALKVYMDDARLLNIPNIADNPTGFTLGTTSHKEGKYFAKNIRIAKGAVPLYDKVLTDGKFITTGIKFDVNKATIKPESMGTINYVVKMMNDNPGLNFTIEGHTDSDGDEARNQTLSEARAKAIRDKMTELGIDASRLKTKGWGESKPMAGNDTPEGKAQNRRVEFVKF